MVCMAQQLSKLSLALESGAVSVAKHFSDLCLKCDTLSHF